MSVKSYTAVKELMMGPTVELEVNPAKFPSIHGTRPVQGASPVAFHKLAEDF